MLSTIRAWLVDDWRARLRHWSTWLAGAGAAIWGVIALIPGAAAEAWAAVPTDLYAQIPHARAIAILMFIAKFATAHNSAILLSKFIKQGGGT